jgi:hypothetical protein
LNQNTTGSAATAIASSTQSLGDSTTNIATTEFVAKGLVAKTNKTYVDNALSAKANLVSPTFSGSPVAPTATSTDSSTVIATTAFVKGSLSAKASKSYVDNSNALKANLASPAFMGAPLAPTAASNDSSTTIATTAFVKGGLVSKASKTYVDNVIAAKASTASPTFTGSPAAPTAVSTDSSTILATTAFVKGGLAGKVSKAYVDNVNALMAPLASPELTGTPTAPTATAGTNTTQVATTAFVKAAVDAVITGSNGTTQSANDNSTKLATTEYVDRADALKANLNSPTFTGTVAAPTATAGDSTTKIATTAFVDRAVTSNTSYTTDVASNGEILIKTATGVKWATEVAESKSRTSSNSNDHVYTLSSAPLAGTTIKVFNGSGAKIKISGITVSGSSVTINVGSSSNPGTLDFYYYK